MDFQQLESGGSNQVAEQNHVDVWPSEGMEKKYQKPSTISSACRLRQLVSTTEVMANLLNEFWTRSSFPVFFCKA